MKKNNKYLLIFITLLLVFSSFVFAEENEDKEKWYVEIVDGLAKWITIGSADFLNENGSITAEDVYVPYKTEVGEPLYGGVNNRPTYKVYSPFLFRFSQNNIFGIFTSKTYPIFKLIAIIVLSTMIGGVALNMIFSRNAQSQRDSIDQVKVLVFSAFVIMFLPELLNMIFYVRDEISYGINQLFTLGGSEGLVTSLQVLAHETDANALDGAIYLAATFFSYWLMFNYIGLSFGFSILLLYTPIAIVLTPARFGKKVAGEIVKDFVGYTLTPLLDITLLGAILTVRNVGADSPVFSTMSPLIFDLFSIALVMMVIPIRSVLKGKLGLGRPMGDMAGVGLAAGAVGMMMRAGRGASKNSSKSGRGSDDLNSEDYADQADYHREISKFESSGNASETKQSTDLPSIDLSKTNRTDFIKQHQGKSYYNERDLGGVSHQEKAAVYEDLTRQAKQNKMNDHILNGAQKVSSVGLKTAGGVLGGSAGLFFGPGGVALGAMAGTKAGGAVANTIPKVGRGIVGVAAWTSDRFNHQASGSIIEDAQASLSDESIVQEQVYGEANIDISSDYSSNLGSESSSSLGVATQGNTAYQNNSSFVELIEKGIENETNNVISELNANFSSAKSKIEKRASEKIQADPVNYQKHLDEAFSDTQKLDKIAVDAPGIAKKSIGNQAKPHVEDIEQKTKGQTVENIRMMNFKVESENIKEAIEKGKLEFHETISNMLDEADLFIYQDESME